MISRENTVFLLGGHDLEMLTIKRLLSSYGFKFLDRNLQWGACASAYADVFEEPDPMLTIYGIELRYDLEREDSRYKSIDHHNGLPPVPGSLEQVASLIGHSLTWDEQLIAANDYGYIPAMQKLGATKGQIGDIRLRDRGAQGVTPEDEKLAELSIANHLEKIGGDTLVVKSLTSRFSAICDRLYPYRRLLVYTDEEWVFYGDGKEALVAEMAGSAGAGNVYYGGGESGFIGVAKGAFSQEEIRSFVEIIKKRYEHI